MALQVGVERVGAVCASPCRSSWCRRSRRCWSSPVTFGFDLGRVDFFSTASQPPARHRAASLPTQTVDIPYCRATRSMRLTSQNCLDDDPVLRHPQGLTKTRGGG